MSYQDKRARADELLTLLRTADQVRILTAELHQLRSRIVELERTVDRLERPFAPGGLVPEPPKDPEPWRGVW